MKMQRHTNSSSPGRGWRRAIVAVFALVFATGASAFAGTPGVGPSASMGDDETVGTLPVLGQNWDLFDVYDVWNDRQPAVYIEGSALDIQSAVTSGSGTGGVTIEVVDPAAQVVRVVFHGDLQFTLDRALFQEARLRVGLAVPRAYGSAVAVMRLGQRSSNAFDLLPGRSLLPVANLARRGMLDSNTFTFGALGRRAARYRIDVSATADELTFMQTR